MKNRTILLDCPYFIDKFGDYQWYLKNDEEVLIQGTSTTEKKMLSEVPLWATNELKHDNFKITFNNAYETQN